MPRHSKWKPVNLIPSLMSPGRLQSRSIRGAARRMDRTSRFGDHLARINRARMSRDAISGRGLDALIVLTVVGLAVATVLA